MKLKVVYVISDVDKSIAFEWIVKSIDFSKVELKFVILSSFNTNLEAFLQNENISVFRINFNGKKDVIKSVVLLTKYLINNKVDVVHTHLFYASFIGTISARIAFVNKRIVTRHYSTLHHEYFPSSVKWDKLINFLATDIIAISENVKKTLVVKENVNPSKISLIYHGFDLNLFKFNNKEVLNELMNKYNSNFKWPIVGVISRFTELKGIQYIIPAYIKLLRLFPNAKLLLFNAHGDYEYEINKILLQLPVDSYQKIKFENDILNLYNIFDIFIHVPINNEIEAFGQTYIESLASGTPSIFTLSGIANEFIINDYNALVVDYMNSDSIYYAMKEILLNHNLNCKIRYNGIESVKRFNLPMMIKSLEELYVS
jgi:glycosyltransferase involved in cell wall biosynthesis